MFPQEATRKLSYYLFVEYHKCIFIATFTALLCLIAIYPTRALANWPLWSGGQLELKRIKYHVNKVEHVRYQILDFYRISKDKVTGRSRLVQLTNEKDFFLQKVEVYRLDHNTVDRYWRLRFTANDTFEVDWSLDAKTWRAFYSNGVHIFKRKLTTKLLQEGIIYIKGQFQRTSLKALKSNTVTPLAISSVIWRHRPTQYYNWNPGAFKQKLRLDPKTKKPILNPKTKKPIIVRGAQPILKTKKGDIVLFKVIAAQKWQKKRVNGVWVDTKNPKVGYISDTMGALRRTLFHNGVDISARAGTSIGAMRGGKVLEIHYPFNVPANEYVDIMVGASSADSYGHVEVSDAVIEKIKLEQNVKLGVIGREHQTKHVHIELYKFLPNKYRIKMNPLGNLITRVDPDPSKKVAVLAVVLKQDDYGKKNIAKFFPYFFPGSIAKQYIQGKVDIRARVGDPTTICTIPDSKLKLEKKYSDKAIQIYAKDKQETCVKSFAFVRQVEYQIVELSPSFTKTPGKILRTVLPTRKMFSATFFDPFDDTDDYKRVLDEKYNGLEGGAEVFFEYSIIAISGGSNSTTVPTNYWPILTNNINPKGLRSGLLRRGTWDTTKHNDGFYEIQVRAESDLHPLKSHPTEPKKKVGEWSAKDFPTTQTTTASYRIVIDNSPPKVVKAKFIGLNFSNTNMAKIGDKVSFEIGFDQPLVPKHSAQGLSLSLVLVSKKDSSLQVRLVTSNLQHTGYQFQDKKNPKNNRFIGQALFKGSFVLPQVKGEFGSVFYIRISGAKGLGKNEHRVNVGSKILKLKDDTVVPFHTKEFRADLEPPKVTISRAFHTTRAPLNTVRVTCSDKVSGLASCSAVGSTVQQIFGPIPQPKCSSKSFGPKVSVMTLTFPFKCQKAFHHVKFGASDCAGNNKATVTQLSPSVVSVPIVIPGHNCRPGYPNKTRSTYSNVKVSFDCKMSPYSSSGKARPVCIAKKSSTPKKPTPPKKSPGQDHPDENVDLSTHNLNKLPQNVQSNAKVAVLESVFAREAIALLATFDEKAAILDRTFTPSAELVRKHPILILPSGSLDGQSSNAAFRKALDAYVRLGGRLLVFAQAWGRDWSALPGGIEGKGWNEVISCFWNAADIAYRHKGFTVVKGNIVSAPIDGYFTKLPPKAQTLLTLRRNQAPAMITYPYGKGLVMAFATFTDWALYWSQQAADGPSIVRDMLTWLHKPGPIRTAQFGQHIKETLKFKHAGLIDAAILQVRILSPNRFQTVHTKRIPGRFVVGSELSVPLDFKFPLAQKGIRGIYRTEVQLIDALNQVVYGPVELMDGRFAVSTTSKEILYSQGIIITANFPQVAPSARTQRVPVDLTITNMLDPSVFPKPRNLRIYVKGGSTQQAQKFVVTLERQKPFTKRIYLTPTHKTFTQLSLQIVVFDSAAPKQSRPDWTKTIKETWPYAASLQREFSLFQPTILTTMRLDRTHYIAGDQVQLDTQFSNRRKIAFPGRVVVMLFTRGKKVSTQTFSKIFNGQSVEKNLQTKVPLPADISDFSRIELEVYDLSGKQPVLIHENRKLIRVPKVHLTAEAVLPLHLSTTKPFRVKLTNYSYFDTNRGYVQAELQNVHGKVLKSASKSRIAIKGGASTEVLLDVTPTYVPLGRYELKFWASADSRRSDARRRLYSHLEMTVLHSPNVYHMGQSTTSSVTFYNQGNFDHKVQVSWLFNRKVKGSLATPVVVSAGKTVTVPFKMTLPKELYRGGWFPFELRAKLPDNKELIRYKQIYVHTPEPQLYLQLPVHQAKAGQPYAFNAQIDPDCCFVPPLSAKLELSVPELLWKKELTVVLKDLQLASVPVQLPIPSKARPGSHQMLAVLTLPSGRKVTRIDYFTVAGPVLKLSLQTSTVTAGSTVNVQLLNAGGIETSYTFQSSIHSPAGKLVVQGKGQGTLKGGARTTLSLTLPKDLATGSYPLSVVVSYAGQTRKLDAKLSVTALQNAGFTLSTDKTNYTAKGPVKGLYSIAAGKASVAGLTLHLRAYQATRSNVQNDIKRYPTPLQGNPYPMYRGSSLRLGSTFGVGLFGTTAATTLWHKALETNSSNSAFTPVIGDLNNDNRNEVVGITSTGKVTALHGETGTQLWQVPLGATGTAALAKIDTQVGSDVIVTTTSCKMVALSGLTGKSIWTSSLGSLCQSTGKPLIVDVDGDGKLDVVASVKLNAKSTSTSRGIVVLEGSSGKVKGGVTYGALGWDTSSAVSAADLGAPCTPGTCTTQTAKKDNKLEVIVSNYSTAKPNQTQFKRTHIVSAYDWTGKARWHLKPQDVQGLDKPESLPLVADLDGDGLNEVIVLLGYDGRSAKHEGGVVVLNGNTGRIKWVKYLNQNPYRDAIAVFPAANNKMNIAILSRKGNENPFTLTILDHAGKTLKSTTVNNLSSFGPEAYLHVTDITGDLKPDLLLQFRDTGLYAVDLQTYKALQLSKASSAIHPVTGDLDGDGLVEIVTGNLSAYYTVLKGRSLTTGEHNPSPDAAGNRIEQKTHWSKKISVPPVSANTTHKGSETFTGPSTSGSYILRGILSNKRGQEIARKQVPFAVGSVSGLELRASVDTLVHPPFEKVTLRGTLSNPQSSTQGNITLKVRSSEGTVLYTKTGIQLTANQSISFTVEYTPSKHGNHAFIVETSGGSAKPLKIEVPFQVRATSIKWQIEAPSEAGQDPFAIRVKLSNTGSVAGNVGLTLYKSGAHADAQYVKIKAGGFVVVTFEQSITADTTFTLVTGLDLRQTQDIKVRFALRGKLQFSPTSPVAAGPIEIPYTLTSLSKLDGTYPIEVHIGAEHSPVLDTTRYVPGTLSRSGSPQVSGVIRTTLSAGKHTFKYRTFGDSGTFTVEVIEPKLSVRFVNAKPTYRADEDISLSYELENTATVKGSFAVQLDLKQDGVSQLTKHRTVHLQAKGKTGSKERNSQMFRGLQPGKYTVVISASPGNVSATHTFEVVSPKAITMASAQGSIKGGEYQITVALENKGKETFSGALFVDAGFTSLHKSFSVAASQKSSLQLSVPLRFAPVGKRTIVVQVRDLAGVVWASKTLTMIREQPALRLIPPATKQTFQAGRQGTLTYIIENKDLFSQRVDFTLSVMERTYQRQVQVPAGTKQSVSIVFPLPDDLEQNQYHALYRWSSTPDVKLLPASSGLTRFEVEGLKVEVKAGLDKRLYSPNENAKLTLSIRSTGKIQNPSVQIRARYAGSQQVKTVKLSNAFQTVILSLPLGALTHSNLTFQVLSLKGRALHINSLLVHKKNSSIWLTTDKDVYKPGETVHYTVESKEEQKVELQAVAYYQPTVHQRNLQLKANQPLKGSFVLPKNVLGGTHSIDYKAKGNTYFYRFNVAGVFVTAKHLQLDQKIYSQGQKMKSELLLEARGTAELEVVYRIVESSGKIHETGITQSIKVDKGLHLIHAVIPTPKLRVGGLFLHADVYLKGNRQLPLSKGVTPFEMGTFYIRSLEPSKEQYYEGIEDAVVKVAVYTVQRVTGILRVTLEGVDVYGAQQTIDGFKTFTITIPKSRMRRQGLFTVGASFETSSVRSDALNLFEVVPPGKVFIEVSGITQGAYYNKAVRPIVALRGKEFAAGVMKITLNRKPFVSDTAIEAEGAYELIALVKTLTGKTIQRNISFVIDKTPPVIEIQGIEEGKVYISVAPVVAAKDKHLESWSATLNGKPFISGTKLEGKDDYTLKVTAKDKAGNSSTRTLSFKIEKPTTPKHEKVTLELEAPKGNQEVNSPLVTVKGKVTPASAKVWIDERDISVEKDGSFEGYALMGTCSGEVTVKASLGEHSAEKKIPLTLFGNHLSMSPLRLLKRYKAEIGGYALHEDSLYISLPENGEVVKASLKGGKWSSEEVFSNELSQPGALAVSQTGKMFVVDEQNEMVYELTANGKKKAISKPLPGLKWIGVLEGDVLVAYSKEKKAIQQLNRGEWSSFITLSQGVTLSSLVVKGKELYALDKSTRIVWLLQQGKTDKHLTLSLNAEHITIDTKGQLYFTSRERGLLYRYDSKLKRGVAKQILPPQGIGLFTVEGVIVVFAEHAIFHATGVKVNCLEIPEPHEVPEKEESQVTPGCSCQVHEDFSQQSVLLLLLFVILLSVRPRFRIQK